jgi:hypothetical protein
MGSREIIDTLLQGYQQRDPRLYDILRMLSAEIQLINNNIVDTVNALLPEDIINLFSLDPPGNFHFSLPGTVLRLTWDINPAASFYEIRKGTEWLTATHILRTSSLRADLDPIQSGEHTYLIKSINANGEYSATSTALTLTIPIVGGIILTSLVVDNNVLLYWTKPSIQPYNILEYEVFREGVSIGVKPGTFTSVFETASGTYTYGVRARDLADNYGLITTIQVSVTEPPDYDLIARQDSTFKGTLTNGYASTLGLLVPVVDETFEDHFIDNSWDTIQEQLTAGYPKYLQPAATSGTYIETFDFGTILTNIIATITWGAESVTVDSVAVTCEICYSEDDSTYTAYVAGNSAFLTSFQYVRIRLTFTPSTDLALAYIKNLKCVLSIRYATDAGTEVANALDALGTFVGFNKDFKDITAITVSCLSVDPITVIYDFVDVPDPTGFYIYAFDSKGFRVNATVTWIARGIVN